jgi:hypothetical protein
MNDFDMFIRLTYYCQLGKISLRSLVDPAGISHQLSAASAHLGMSTALRSFGLLGHAGLKAAGGRFAAKPGERCGLVWLPELRRIYANRNA